MRKINKNCACFLAQASHDLRQPLQALMLYLDLFDTHNLSPKQKEVWQKIMQTTSNIKLMLNNVLDFSKLEFGNVKPNKNAVNLEKMLIGLSEEFEVMAKKNNLDFEYNICKCVIFTDALLLERILRNLMSNAFKFTKNKVVLSCEEFADSVKISVSDNGNGIGLEEQNFIFDEFYQGKNACVLNNDGAGLGLAIVKKIATILEIDIKVESTLGNGSNFSLTVNKN